MNCEPDRDAVPDEETALAIGLAILVAQYGRDLVARYEPYRVVSAQTNWAVVGTSEAHAGASRLQRQLGPENLVIVRGGGAPEILISRKDSRVLAIARAR